MEFSTDQAKTIFDLIKVVSPYAYPLLISLVFPIFWIAIKKLMGLSNNEANTNPPQGGPIRRFFSEIGSIISLEGDTADRIVFYACVILFFVGGVTLKIGEHDEEIIRQNTLSLKNLYNENGYLFYDTSALSSQGYPINMINDITYNYPNAFLKSGTRVICVDSTVKRNVFAINTVLLESFLREKFRNSQVVYADSLFQEDVEIRNVKNFFSSDIVYYFLGQITNKEKYNIGVINDKTVIIKPDGTDAAKNSIVASGVKR